VNPKSRKTIGAWLMIGVFMIFIQVIIGGITRLTGSGLSITKWEIVTGTVPPLNETQWQAEFEQYQASPQYQKINRGMTVGEFKNIYFWEYFHRLWARLLGFVFLIPFIYFLVKKQLSRELKIKALIAFLLGAIVGAFGWIMVASGLVDLPMVSPYRLAAHLSLALITLIYLFWVALGLLVKKDPDRMVLSGQKKTLVLLLVMVCIQIIFGALVSGMRAASFYPTWPDMNGQFFPDDLFSFSSGAFPVAFVQFFHRMIGYVIFILTFAFIFKYYKSFSYRLSKLTISTIGLILIVQILLGIFTLLNSIGTVPVALGVIHQGVAILLLMAFFFFIYLLSGKNKMGKQ
jgi:heme a synthase